MIYTSACSAVSLVKSPVIVPKWGIIHGLWRYKAAKLLDKLTSLSKTASGNHGTRKAAAARAPASRPTHGVATRNGESVGGSCAVIACTQSGGLQQKQRMAEGHVVRGKLNMLSLYIHKIQDSVSLCNAKMSFSKGLSSVSLCNAKMSFSKGIHRALLWKHWIFKKKTQRTARKHTKSLRFEKKIKSRAGGD